MQNNDINMDIPEGWLLSEDQKSISRNLKFKNFTEAWQFMEKVALSAEQQNHHPNWSNCWNTVNITLTTHDQGDLTTKDIELATTINKYIT